MINCTPPRSTCAVSVIIPLYNAEKYIAETLDSLLAQTFQDFEVVIVNDCSTDSSRAIAESYVPKFGGRMTLFDNETNSKSGAIPRNIGLMHATGEYVFLMDNDDMLIPTALEEMHTPAKEFDADVVYCEKYFQSDDTGGNLQLKNTRGLRYVKNPTLETDDLSKRLEYILKRHFLGYPWLKFVKRNLLIENEIFFPNVKPCDDHIWTYGLFFYAKKFLRIPNAVYIYRQVAESILHTNRSPVQKINLWLYNAIFGLKFLDDMMGKHEFFRQNPQYRYAILEQFTTHMFDLSFRSSLKLQQHSIYEGIKNEFGDRLGEYDVLIPVLCAVVNKHQKAISNKNDQIAKLEEKLKTIQNILTSAKE